MNDDPKLHVTQEFVDRFMMPRIEIRDWSTKVPGPTNLQSVIPLYCIRIHDRQNEPLVTIEMDGCVTIHNPQSLNEAAELFWSTVEHCFKQHVKQLRDQGA